MVKLKDIVGVDSLSAISPSDLEGKTPLRYSAGKSKARYFNTGITKNIYVVGVSGRLNLIHFRFDNTDKNNYITYRYNDHDDTCIEQHSATESPYITIIIDKEYTLTLTTPRTGLVYVYASDEVKLYE